jgi:cysteine desulfurase family protein (TIGR01976 family)
MLNPHDFFAERRKDFPSLHRTDNGKPLIYLDGPGGTQAPQLVIDAITHYYRTCNANTHGQYVTSRESDAIIDETRKTMTAFFGAEKTETVSFGANMTTLTFSLSKAIARILRPDDEIVITQLDHEGNRTPWLTLQENGIVIREVLLKKDGTLDYTDMKNKINSRTRLVAIGLSSNALGTVNDIAVARELSSAVGAWLFADAVHFAPHFPIDVAALGVDFLVCSAYKFYGPHVGILYSRPGLLDQLKTDRLATQSETAPSKIETGTLNHAALAGTKAAVEYIASIGTGVELREKIVNGMKEIGEHEHLLAEKLYNGLKENKRITLYGQNLDAVKRSPTIAFTMDDITSAEISRCLGDLGICTWDGHFYARRAIEVLGLLEHGGVVRLGISMYNTTEEILHVLAAVKNLRKK